MFMDISSKKVEKSIMNFANGNAVGNTSKG